jgi:tRNA (guanine26-N2/guanine27-N2)-dimethyltransferase
MALDALAGTGARSVRWLVEAGLKGITINDRSAGAAQAIAANLERNGVGAHAEVLQRDARVLLAERCFQHVELDPYGSPAPFFDAAFGNLGRRGAVSFTATDAAALCGASPRACVRRYAAIPTRTDDLCHEAALRILLAAAVREAAKHDQGAVPVLANNREHYFRCTVETRRAARLADELLGKLQWLVECEACLHRGFEPEKRARCPACGEPANASGPMWAGPLWDAALLQDMDAQRAGRTLADAREAEKDLALWAAEARIGGLPFDVHIVTELEGLAEPPPIDAVLAALQAMGHPAARSHHSGRLVRTPAPAKDVRVAVREAARA